MLHGMELNETEGFKRQSCSSDYIDTAIFCIKHVMLSLIIGQLPTSLRDVFQDLTTRTTDLFKTTPTL